MTSIGSPCQLCVDNCYDDTHYECRAACQPYDSPCERACDIPVNRCLLDNCLKGGQCCEEACQPPQTPCQLCDNDCLDRFGTCEDEECEYFKSHCRLACFNGGQCCTEACQGPPGSFLEQYQTKAMFNRAPVPQSRNTYGTRQVAPLRRNTQHYENAPLRRNTQEYEIAPLRRNTQQCEIAPLRRNTGMGQTSVVAPLRRNTKQYGAPVGNTPQYSLQDRPNPLMGRF